MSNPNKKIAVVKAQRVAGGTEFTLQSDILEEKIAKDASIGPEPLRALANPPQWWNGKKVYRVLLPTIDEVIMRSEPDESLSVPSLAHLLRCEGLKDGVKVTIASPMSARQTARLAASLRDYIKQVYEEYYSDVDIEYNLYEVFSETVEGTNG